MERTCPRNGNFQVTWSLMFNNATLALKTTMQKCSLKSFPFIASVFYHDSNLTSEPPSNKKSGYFYPLFNVYFTFWRFIYSFMLIHNEIQKVF